ncbi:DUF6268 family outer membrane beta-barrel protein [Paracrocinitomix mangrovi]|uniref:DUF6268 family outer membrane beta-barrel protein n=1 Tax=Paracrocinitomix mangrovi TaxID=2862509 RepID=UPI001C8DBA89|nr:DUF6268 family outer membrane beta-barrel protein [Paracrocinitomix mangrovi]UKN00280.1 DUF6268 family outer membrane beta-barrel protein [Paracrocinitomix mangrovi]
MIRFLIILIFFAVQPSFGQKWFDLANVYWRTSPSAKIEGSSEKRHFNTYIMDVKAPIVLDDKNLLLFGIEYQYNTITSNNPGIFPAYRFASHMLQLGYEHKWNTSFKTLFMLMPRLNTDYSQVNFSHFQLGGLTLFSKERSEDFIFMFGAYYNGELFGPMIVPIVGFNWAISEKWRWKMLAPLNLELAYMPKNWFRTGLRFDGFNASYRYQLIPGDPNSNRYIDKADNNAYLFTEFHLGKNCWINLRAGHSILRKYRFFQLEEKMDLKVGPFNVHDDRNNDDPKAVPVLFKNSLSFEARFIYRLPLD